jgi:hypothetical protein
MYIYIWKNPGWTHTGTDIWSKKQP